MGRSHSQSWAGKGTATDVTVAADPTAALQCATKQYVDAHTLQLAYERGGRGGDNGRHAWGALREAGLWGRHRHNRRGKKRGRHNHLLAGIELTSPDTSA